MTLDEYKKARASQKQIIPKAQTISREEYKKLRENKGTGIKVESKETETTNEENLQSRLNSLIQPKQNLNVDVQPINIANLSKASTGVPMHNIFATAKQNEERKKAEWDAMPTTDKVLDITGKVVGTPVAAVGMLGTGVAKAGESTVDALLGLQAISPFNPLKDNPQYQERIRKIIETPFVDKYIGEANREFANEYSYLPERGQNIAQTVGNMLPAIATGNALNAGMVPFGLQAGGGSLEEALNSGATMNQAVAYGALSGTMEGLVEAISGGIGGYASETGKKVIGKVLGKETIDKIAKNAIGKYGIKLLERGVDVFGEGAEEVVSTLIDPFLKRLTYDEWAELATSKEALQSFIDGALASVIVSGMGDISNVATNREIQKEAKRKQISQEVQDYKKVSPYSEYITKKPIIGLENLVNKQLQGIKEVSKLPNIDTKTQNQLDSLGKVDENSLKGLENLTPQKSDVHNQIVGEENTQDKQVIPNEIKPAKNVNMEDTKQNDIKTQIESNIMANKYLSDIEKTNLIDSLGENISSDTENAINELLKTVNEEGIRKETVQIAKEESAKYKQYLKDTTELDRNIINTALDSVHANKSGRRTKEQWLSVAKSIGQQIYNKADTEIERYAYKTWQEMRPNAKENLNRQGKGYTKFTMDEWVNTIYRNVKELRNRTQAVAKKVDTTQMQMPTAKTNAVYNTAKQLNVDTQLANRVMDMAKLTEVPVNGFVDVNENIDGYYKDGAIYINKNSKKAQDRIFVHELTHNIEKADGWQGLRDTIFNSNVLYNELAENGQTLDEYRQLIKDRYAENGIELNEDDIDREVIAKFAEEHLLKDQKSIDRMVQENPTFMQRVKNFIDDLVVKFKGTAEEKELLRIQRMYDKAFAESKQVEAKQGTQYSLSVAEQKYDLYSQKADSAYNARDEYREQYDELYNSDEVKNAVQIAVKTKDMTEYLKYDEQLKKLREKAEYYDAEGKKYSEMAKEYASEIDTAENEQKAGMTADDRRKAAVKEFGYTPYFYDAGYLLPNGKMLNFSGEKGQHYGTRGQDHRAIGMVYDSLQGSQAMNAFMNEGNIRVVAESPGLDISKEASLTSAQYKTIKEMVYEYQDKGRFLIDFSNADGKTIESLRYEGRFSAEQVVNDIKRYLQTGEVNRQSDIQKFRYSINTDNQGRQLSKQQQEYFKDSNQIKAVDNLNPTENEDIRYSVETREVDFPEKVGDRYLSRHAKTLAESGVTMPETVDLIEKMVKDGSLTHERITDKKALAYAEKYIEENGFKDAVDHWNHLVKSNRELSKEELALGQLIFNTADTNQDVQLVKKMIADLVVKGTQAGRSLQAMSMVKKMTPDGRLYSLERTVQKLNQDLREQFGKDFKDIEIPDDLAEKLLKSKTTKETDAAVEEIQQYIADRVPATWGDKANAWRYLAMLGNPRTHIRNVLGNAVFIPAVEIKNLIATGIEKTLPKAERTKAVVGLKDTDLLNFAESDFDTHQEAVRGENKYDITAGVQEKQRVFNNKVLETLRKKNFELLEKEDATFLKYHYKRAMASALKARGITLKELRSGTPEAIKKLDEVRQYAINEAQKATYRDFNSMANAVSSIKRKLKRASGSSKAAKVGSMVAEGIMPFTKTPANILKRGIEYSPVGLGKGIYDAMTQVKKGNVTASQAIDEMAAGLTGTGIIMLGALLKSLGLIVGGDEEKQKEQNFEKLKGNQNYALKIGNKTYTIDWMAPSSMPLFVGVEVVDLLEAENISDIIGAIGNITDPVFELSMLQGLNSTMDTLGSDNPLWETFKNTVESYFAQYNPTFLGQIARTIDPKRRTTYADKNSIVPSGIQTFAQKQLQKIPFASKALPTYKDQFGRESETENVVERIFSNFMSPGYLADVKDQPVENELTKLYEKTGESAILPSYATKSITVNKEKKNLTAKEYDTFAKVRGNVAYDNLEKLMTSQEYKSMDDEQKIKAIKKIYDYANSVGKSKVSDYELTKSEQQIQDYEKAGIDYYKWLILQDKADTNKNGYVTKDEMNKALNKSGLTSTQKALIKKNMNKSK